MSRRVLVALAVLVVAAGISIAYRHWARPMPPPPGEISLEEVTPPDNELTIEVFDFCLEEVPGLWAQGTSSRSLSETRTWFDQRFGDTHEEATARLNANPSLKGEFSVYDDIVVFTRNQGRGVFVWVQTYETTSHFCVSRHHDVWDPKNASAFDDACGDLAVEFWGVEYGAPKPMEPPPDWPVMTFDGGQEIAHSTEKPSIIYARISENDVWMRYRESRVCYLD